MNRKIRIALAALAALMALSVIGATGVASAASRPTEGGVFAIAHNGVAEMVNNGEYFKSVESWHIGGGGYRDAMCGRYAGLIGEAVHNAQMETDIGNSGGAEVYEETADTLEDEALGNGCVVLYT